MRNIIIAFCFFLCIGQPVNAQLSKNTWLFGGDGSLQSYEQTTTSLIGTNVHNVREIDISASAGYFVVNKLAMGVRPEYIYRKGETKDGSGEFAAPTTYAVGPFLRYYILDAEKPFNILFDAAYKFGWPRYPKIADSKGSYREFSLLAGPEVFFNSSVAIQLLFGFRNSHKKIRGDYLPGEEKRTGLYTTIGFAFHLEKY